MFEVWFLKILRYCWAYSKWNYLMHFSLNLIVYIHWILKLKRDIILFGSIKQKHLPGMCMFRHTVRDFVESAFNSRMWVTKDGQVQSLFHPVFVVIYSYLTFYSIEYLDILTKFCYINKCHFEKFEMWQILLLTGEFYFCS